MYVGRTETVTQIDGNRLDTGNQKVRFKSLHDICQHKTETQIEVLRGKNDKI